MESTVSSAPLHIRKRLTFWQCYARRPTERKNQIYVGIAVSVCRVVGARIFQIPRILAVTVFRAVSCSPKSQAGVEMAELEHLHLDRN